MSRTWRHVRHWLFLSAAASTSCSLDDRTLEPAGDSTSRDDVVVRNSSHTEASTNDGSTDAGSDSGTEPELDDPSLEPLDAATSDGPSDASPPDPTDEQSDASDAKPVRCPDLDDNGTLDCDESLVVNPSFAKNLNRWKPEQDGATEWTAEDAVENPRSGSLLVTNSTLEDSSANGFTGAAQCLAVQPGHYKVFAQVWIDAQTSPGSAGLIVSVFDDDSCEGQVLDGESLFTIATMQWVTVGRSLEVPPAGRSLAIRLGVLKPFDAEPFSARIDNVLVRRE